MHFISGPVRFISTPRFPLYQLLHVSTRYVPALSEHAIQTMRTTNSRTCKAAMNPLYGDAEKQYSVQLAYSVTETSPAHWRTCMGYTVGSWCFHGVEHAFDKWALRAAATAKLSDVCRR